jgi:hypothetical protein
MDLRFVVPDLRQLDLITTEILVVPVGEGDRPPRGTAGLVDYRLGGAISRLIADSSLSGTLGQIHLVSGRPRLSFDRVLLLGEGRAEEMNAQVYRGALEQLLATLQHLGARRAVVELPGRRNGAIDTEQAVEILLELTAGNPWFDTWTLIESPSAQRVMMGLLRRDQRQRWVPGT